MGRMSRDKGKRGELEAAAFLKELFGCDARRTQQYCGGAGDADLTTSIEGVHFEVKRKERFNLYESLDQAYEDSSQDATPVVLHRRNNREWVVALYLKDLPQLARQVIAAQEEKDDARESII